MQVYTSSDDQDTLAEIVNKLKPGTRQVRVPTQALRSIVLDHGRLVAQVEKLGDQIEVKKE